MHIVIVGAGLAGVTAAWYLREYGHRVTVIERREGAALEASFANGGQISMSHPEPWANPGAPAAILRWLGRRDAPLLFRMPAEFSRWRWGLEFLRECLPGRTRRNTLAIARLASYSGRLLRQLREQTGISYNHLTHGVLHLYFSEIELRHGEQQHRILERMDIRSKMLTREECVQLDPALTHVSQRIVGGMLGEDDESGDAHRFTHALAQMCSDANVQFLFNCTVQALESDGRRITGLHILDAEGRRGALNADAYILAAGVHSKPLVKQLGERLPIYPVKGYSATCVIQDSAAAPYVSVTDETRRIVCSRMGDRLRIAGTAELNGYNLDLDAVRCEALIRWAEDLFPGACDLSQVQYWAGLRPATPSNVPIIGRSKLNNLYYNTGHGSLGWTLACGSAKALADIIDGRQAEPDFPFLLDGIR